HPRPGLGGSSMTAAVQTRPATRAPSPRDRLRDFAEAHRSTSVIVGMLIVAALMVVLPRFPPLSFIQREQSWFDAFANAGVFALLAMGLNVVVGLAGLLDLGYAAFFAIGAYTYAY